MAEPFDGPLEDQPLVRSLRAPGTPAELERTAVGTIRLTPSNR